jgi:hypothetical protein
VKPAQPDRPAATRLPTQPAADHRPEVVYCGFLAPPFDGLDLRHVPINYAARRPAALLDLLPAARVVVLTDQQDSPLPPSLDTALTRAVAEDGRRLLFFCYWSAAWGRGFFDTYCSIAESSVAQLLPLRFERGIGSTSQLNLAGPGQTLWADLPWSTAPPLDYNRASLVPDAVCWARAADGTPVAASHVVGQGRVVAIGLDGFGFGHGTLVGWAGQRPLLRRALDWLRGGV